MNRIEAFTALTQRTPKVVPNRQPLSQQGFASVQVIPSGYPNLDFIVPAQAKVPKGLVAKLQHHLARIPSEILRAWTDAERRRINLTPLLGLKH